MRILYIDIDSLRADHLGCYGYARDTSPNIDRLAAEGIRLNHCYASDVPCLPSRTSMFRGQFGIHHGAVNHSGARAQPFNEGAERGFRSRWSTESWPGALRRAGHRTATISSFAERHGAWHVLAGFDEAIDTGGAGHEIADAATPLAERWLADHAAEADWFLHVNYWDVHTPPRTPPSCAKRFADGAPPDLDWLTEATLAEHWRRPGLRSARDPMTLHQFDAAPFDTRDKVAALIDGYDTATRYVDDHVGRLLGLLELAKVADETMVIIAADHGECLGELNCYGGHCLVDHLTARVPMILRPPRSAGLPSGHVDDRLHYHFDAAATVLDWAGAPVPETWDGRSFAGNLASGGREWLVCSQLAQAAQRSVRFRHAGGEYLYLRTWHDAFTGLPEEMLFDLVGDPHETSNLAPQRVDLLERGRDMLERWTTDALAHVEHCDPLTTVLNEQPEMVRGKLEPYCQRLRETGRAEWADELTRRYAP